MEVKSRCSFLGCGCTGQISLGSHRAGGGVDVIGAREIGLSSCRKGHRAARASNRPMYLALHSLT
jgi:hypothetical protein